MQPNPVMKGARTRLLARHGQTLANKEHRLQGRSINFGLTEEGRLQAERLANFLVRSEQVKPSVIIASPLVRAQETASIIATRLLGNSSAFVTHPDLVEIDFGDIQNASLDTLRTTRVDAAEYYAGLNIDIAYPGGESIRGAQERMVRAYSEIMNAYGEHTPLIISHGGVIRLLVAWILRTEYIQPIYHYNTGLTILDELDGKVAVRTMNSTTHLNPLYD